MSAELGEALAGTLVLWMLSAALAILFALALAGGSLSPRRSVRLLARSVINVTRGIPTVLLVIVAGFGMLRLPNAGELPIVFPGTLASVQHVARAARAATPGTVVGVPARRNIREPSAVSLDPRPELHASGPLASLRGPLCSQPKRSARPAGRARTLSSPRKQPLVSAR
jgi:hypothetical protein